MIKDKISQHDLKLSQQFFVDIFVNAIVLKKMLELLSIYYNFENLLAIGLIWLYYYAKCS